MRDKWAPGSKTTFHTNKINQKTIVGISREFSEQEPMVNSRNLQKKCVKPMTSSDIQQLNISNGYKSFVLTERRGRFLQTRVKGN